jgi:hypothetical protein
MAPSSDGKLLLRSVIGPATLYLFYVILFVQLPYLSMFLSPSFYQIQPTFQSLHQFGLFRDLLQANRWSPAVDQPEQLNMPTAPISNLSGALAELVVQFWPTFQPQNVTNTCQVERCVSKTTTTAVPVCLTFDLPARLCNLANFYPFCGDLVGAVRPEKTLTMQWPACDIGLAVLLMLIVLFSVEARCVELYSQHKALAQQTS